MDDSRRNTLKLLTRSVILVGSAVLLGGQVSRVLAAGGSFVLFYSSKYGATRDTAKWIAEGIKQPVELVDISDANRVNSALSTPASYILGSAVYREQPTAEMQAFVETNKQALDGNTIASFVVCGTQPDSVKNRQRIESYLERLNAPLVTKPKFTRQLGGRLIVDKLLSEDREKLTHFYEKILMKPLEDWDRTDKAAAANLAAVIAESLS